jgi:hypothetical protein
LNKSKLIVSSPSAHTGCVLFTETAVLTEVKY